MILQILENSKFLHAKLNPKTAKVAIFEPKLAQSHLPGHAETGRRAPEEARRKAPRGRTGPGIRRNWIENR